MCIFCGYDAVEQDFDEGHVSSWCANIVRIVDSVSPGGESCAIFFFLVWYNFAAVTTICHVFYSVFWYLVFGDEKMLFILFTLLPTPWARRLNLLASEVDHVSLCLGS